VTHPTPLGRGDIPPCPVCSGRTEIVYDRFNQIVVVCRDCHAGITIPSSAWEVKRLKALGKWDFRG